MTEQQHQHRYVDVKHPVGTLDGVAEVLVQRRCACGAIKGQENEGKSPELGEWI